MPLTDLVADFPALPLWQPIRFRIMEDAVYEEMCVVDTMPWPHKHKMNKKIKLMDLVLDEYTLLPAFPRSVV